VVFSYRFQLRFTLARYIRLREHRGRGPGDFNHNEDLRRSHDDQAGNGVVTPKPIQAGMTGSRKRLRFVKAGDNCASIAKEAGILLADFCR
jgi:hypothetical protein